MESLNNPNDVGEAVGIKDGFAVPMLVEKKEPRIPEFDEVKSKVADAIKHQRAKDQLEQKAKDLAASLTVRTQSRPPVKKKASTRAPKSRSNSAHRSARQVSALRSTI